MSALRVLVVGAGPAGTRAAETLASHGLRPIVVDEGKRSGGQIYRRPPEGFARPPEALYGFAAAKAARLHAAFDALEGRIDYRPESLVWNVWEGSALVLGPRGQDVIPFDAILLASGAMDRTIPFPGWTLPGVFTLGGAQVALKYQACHVGRRVVFAGTGPLLYLVAYQYLRSGAEIVALIDSARASDGLAALPKLFAGAGALAKGLYYQAFLRLRGIAHFAGAGPLQALGEGHVEAVRFRDGSGRERRLRCDALAVGWGLKSETQLADLLRCPFRFDPLDRQWLPERDENGRAARPGVYLAGDGAGILGADAAELEGELAALALLADHGRKVDRRRMAELHAMIAHLARFREGLERAFPFPARFAVEIPDETILCRCEAIRAGEFRAVLREDGARELNRAKALSRVGMGRCQGRVCGPAATEVAAATLGIGVEAVGRLRGQAPVKPLPIRPLLPEGERGAP